MMVEVKNNNNILIYYHAKLHGNVSGKSLDAYNEIEFDGLIPAGETRDLMYGRIF
jgi:hypothetical protein